MIFIDIFDGPCGLVERRGRELASPAEDPLVAVVDGERCERQFAVAEAVEARQRLSES